MQKAFIREKNPVPVICKSADFNFCEIHKEGFPVVLKNFNVGPCIEKWDLHYLSSVVDSEEVKVHVTTNPLMNFIEKNFFYKSIPFDELLKRTFEDKHEKYFIDETELYYLRSLGSNPRKDAADIRKQFPQLSKDICIPSILQEDQIFSTVFRIASSGVSLWTHYDIMDNMLIQIRGKKRAVLFPPKDVPYLYLKGDKSEVVDIDNPDFGQHPKFANVHWYETILEAGDILFIPALWFHNMKYLEPGIAVNVFWKSLESSLYDTKDPYGNKDLLPGQKAFTFLEKAIASIEGLPPVYKDFYLQRLLANLENKVIQTSNICS